MSVKREHSGEMRMGLLGFPFINFSSIPKRVAPSGWCLRAWSSECLNPNVPPLLDSDAEVGKEVAASRKASGDQRQ